LIIDNIPYGEIRTSPTHGYGLFSKKKIYKDEIICILDGQVIQWDRYESIKDALSNLISNKEAESFLFTEWNALDEKTLLARTIRTKYSFINHSRDANLVIKYNPVRVVSRVDIEKGTEMLLDYRKEPLRKEYIEGHGRSYL
jgi:SET domain-containing protein